MAAPVDAEDAPYDGDDKVVAPAQALQPPVIAGIIGGIIGFIALVIVAVILISRFRERRNSNAQPMMTDGYKPLMADEK